MQNKFKRWVKHKSNYNIHNLNKSSKKYLTLYHYMNNICVNKCNTDFYHSAYFYIHFKTYSIFFFSLALILKQATSLPYILSN